MAIYAPKCSGGGRRGAAEGGNARAERGGTRSATPTTGGGPKHGNWSHGVRHREAESLNALPRGAVDRVIQPSRRVSSRTNDHTLLGTMNSTEAKVLDDAAGNRGGLLDEDLHHGQDSRHLDQRVLVAAIVRTAEWQEACAMRERTRGREQAWRTLSSS